MNNVKIGYIRVSISSQDYKTQKKLLQTVGCEMIFYEENTASSSKSRKELKKALEYLRKGDTFIVTKMDRLARSIINLNKMIKNITDKGVNIHFVNENLLFKATKNPDSIQLLLFNILKSFSQFERDILVERTSEGREKAKKQGKHLGRPGQPKENVKRALELYNNRSENRLSVADISRLTKVPRSTIYNELKKGQ